MNIYNQLKNSFEKLIVENNFEDETITVDIKTLSPEESIGKNTKRKDFPILTGKESMIEATFKGAKGQAFTTARVSFNGKLSDLSDLYVGENTYDTAIMKYIKLIDQTVH